LRNNRNARAAASKAGPRLAEVAGKMSSSARDCFEFLRLRFVIMVLRPCLYLRRALCFFQDSKDGIDTRVKRNGRTLSRSQSVTLTFMVGFREQVSTMKPEREVRILE